MHLQPGSHLARFELIEVIGQGAMGVVWRARDGNLRREVAIKVLRPEYAMDRERLRLFRDEAASTAAIEHPNVVIVYELGAVDGAHFIAMQLVNGRALGHVLAGKPLDAQRVVHLGEQIASGLGAAHERGLLHRDLKPGNILVTAQDRAKIVDFGLAVLASVKHTTVATEDPTVTHLPGSGPTSAPSGGASLAAGTLPYMSREQLRGEALDQRSDLYSLGVVLYEMLSARRPFEAKTSVDLIAAILARSARPLLDVAPDVPKALAAVVHRAIAPDPADRFASAEELAQALRRANHTRGAQRATEPAHPAVGSPVANLASHQSAPRSRIRLVVGALILGLLGVIALGWYFVQTRATYFSEEFAQANKNDLLRWGWSLGDRDEDLWNRPDRKGHLTLFTTRGDFSLRPDEKGPVRNLLLRHFDARDFQATTVIHDFNPIHEWQQAGIVLMDNEDRYVRVTVGCDSSGGSSRVGVQILVEDKGQVVEHRELHLHDEVGKPMQNLWLRLERHKDQFTARTRVGSDGQDYWLVGSISFPFTPRFIGLAAFHGNTKDLLDGTRRTLTWDPLPAHFDFLRVQPLKP